MQDDGEIRRRVETMRAKPLEEEPKLAIPQDAVSWQVSGSASNASCRIGGDDAFLHRPREDRRDLGLHPVAVAGALLATVSTMVTISSVLTSAAAIPPMRGKA
jgi:hypothetical protein